MRKKITTYCFLTDDKGTIALVNAYSEEEALIIANQTLDKVVDKWEVQQLTAKHRVPYEPKAKGAILIHSLNYNYKCK